MEYDLQPQWRQWTNVTCQYPTCGRCGLSHAKNICYAVRRQCFKCRNYGHYGRMCKTLQYVKKQAETVQESNQRSTGKKVRDSTRMSLYLERKRSMRELPFFSLRPGAFRETVLNNNILSDQLLSMKEKLSMKCDHLETKIRNIKGNLQNVKEELDISQKHESECREKLAKTTVSYEDLKQQLKGAFQREKDLEQKLTISNKQNTELTERLQIATQQKRQNPLTDNSKLIGETASLQKQLEEKDKHCELLKKFCCEMEASYEQKLKEEKELTECEKRLRVESEQAMVKQFLDLQSSVLNDLELIKQQRMTQNGFQGHPHTSCQSNQCYHSPTNPFRQTPRGGRSYRGRGRF